MRKLKALPEFIDGFRVVEDLGIADNEKRRKAVVECKFCSSNFVAVIYKLKYRNRCDCRIVRNLDASLIHLMPLYRAMVARCYNPKERAYINYGAKNISVSDEWLSNPNNFISWAIDSGYIFGLSLDRIDNDKGYSSQNCRWVTPHEQLQNQKQTKLSPELIRLIRKESRSMNQYELARKYNVHQSSISRVINKLRWSNID